MNNQRVFKSGDHMRQQRENRFAPLSKSLNMQSSSLGTLNPVKR